MGKYLFVLLIFLSVAVCAQSPHGFKYQAMPSTLDGQPLINKEISFKISIIQSNIDNDPVYTEIHHSKSNNVGIVNFVIGKGTFVTSEFSKINWSEGPFYIKVEFDPKGGTDYINMGVSEILSVPFAMYAEKSGDGITDGEQVIKGKKTFTSPVNARLNGTVILNNNAPEIEGALRWNGGDFQGFNGENWISLTTGGGTVDIDSISWVCGDFLIDTRDDHTYKTVLIGEQCWMQENLIFDSGPGSFAGTGEYAPKIAGRYYNWASALNVDQKYNSESYNAETSKIRGVCPSGWHLPSHEEFEILESQPEITGLTLQEGGGSGFEAKLFGDRLVDGSFDNVGVAALFWSSSEFDNENAWKRILFDGEEEVGVFKFEKSYGFSIRCVKD